MNRRKLLKTITVGLGCFVTGLSSGFLSKKKIGHLSVYNLPDGTRPGDWVVFDNRTKKYLFPDIDDGEDRFLYSILESDDINGKVSIGISKRNKKDGYRILERNKVITGLDITNKYIGKDKRYLQYS